MLYVWMLLRSLKDMGHVELVFNWGYYYYYINDGGVTYLRKQLGLEDESICPNTFINKKKAGDQQDDDEGVDNRPNRRRFGEGR